MTNPYRLFKELGQAMKWRHFTDHSEDSPLGGKHFSSTCLKERFNAYAFDPPGETHIPAPAVKTICIPTIRLDPIPKERVPELLSTARRSHEMSSRDSVMGVRR